MEALSRRRLGRTIPFTASFFGRCGVSSLAWDMHELFRRHARELTRSLRRRGVSPDTAADITQDAFVRMLTAGPDRDIDNPRAYLYRVSRNLVVDYARRERAAPIVPISEEALLSVADSTPSAETALYDRQRLRISEAALAELPERTRAAFRMHRLDGLTIAEVGERIGLSTTQTWTLIRDAYRHVRHRLKDI